MGRRRARRKVPKWMVVSDEDLRRWELEKPNPAKWASAPGEQTKVEKPLARTPGAVQYLGPAVPAAEEPSADALARRARGREDRPMTPRTEARRARLVQSKSPARSAGSRGYQCEVPSSAAGQRILQRRRKVAMKNLPTTTKSLQRLKRTMNAPRPRSASSQRSGAGEPLWARPATAGPTMQSTPSMRWDRAILPPAPSTCSLRPQRSLIAEAERAQLRDLRASLEEDSRQQLLVRMADAPAKRPSTAPARTGRTRRPRRKRPESSGGGSSSVGEEVPARPRPRSPERQTTTFLGTNSQKGVLLFEIMQADGIMNQYDASELFQIHVRGIGVHGWDGTPEGRGTYENEAALRDIFERFGVFLGATIRHRIEDGKNTSWALITMGDEHSVERALTAPTVMAGASELTIEAYSTEQADASTGQMVRVKKEAASKEKRETFCRIAFEGSSWHTSVALGHSPEWNELSTTFVEDADSCLIIDVVSPSRPDADCCVAIKVSSLGNQPAEKWYPLTPRGQELTMATTGEDTPDAAGKSRLLLRTQFVPRAADAEEKHPELHKQLNNHHEQLETATEGAAGRLRVCVQAGRNLGTGGGPVPVPYDSFAVVEYGSKTAPAGETAFGEVSPQWGTTAGPFEVESPHHDEDHGHPVVVRVHRWRPLAEPGSCSAAYELLGAAAINVRHALHRWERVGGPSQDSGDPTEIVVEAWVTLHSWAERTRNSPQDTEAAWMGGREEGVVDCCGDVLVRLAFVPTGFKHVERPLPFHTKLHVTLMQCHRLAGSLSNSVMIELSLHESAHEAAQPVPYKHTGVETWCSKTVDEMFSPTFFESFLFFIQSTESCLRLDIYELTYEAESLHIHSGHGHMERAVSRSPSRGASPQKRPRKRKIKSKKLLCAAVVPFLRLISTTTPHWYSLLDEDAVLQKTRHIFDSMHSQNVDSMLSSRDHHVLEQAAALLPHGAIQFAAHVSTGHDVEDQKLYLQTKRKQDNKKHARVTISDISISGLPRVPATGRTGAASEKLIEPSPMVRVAFGEHSRDTSTLKRTHEAAWKKEVIHLPFSWEDDGDGEVEPEELEAAMKLHGALTCKVYHRANRIATEREQLIGSVTLSLVELVFGPDADNPLPRTHTIFKTVGHGARELIATGQLQFTVKIETEGHDELPPGETWEGSSDEDDDDPMHLSHPHAQLHYTLKTRDSLRKLPMVRLEEEEEKADSEQVMDDDPPQPGEPDTVISVAVNILRLRHLPDSLTRPVCRVFLAPTRHKRAGSPPRDWNHHSHHHNSQHQGGSPGSSSHGHDGPHHSVSPHEHGGHHQRRASPRSPRSHAHDNCFFASPDVHGQLTIEKTVKFNTPDEDKVLHVEVFQNLGSAQEPKLGPFFGRASLPLVESFTWSATSYAEHGGTPGPQWHPLLALHSAERAIKFDEDSKNGEGPSADEPASIQLSAVVSSALKKVSPHVVCAVSKQTAAAAIEDSWRVEDSTNDDDEFSMGVSSGVRIFFDSIHLDRLDEVNEVEGVLLEAKTLWSKHHSYDYNVEDMMPIVHEVFGMFKRDDLRPEMSKAADKNVEDWVRSWKGDSSTWTFKHFCKFWRKVVDDTVTYAIRLGECFRTFYSRALAADHFKELDTDGSGHLEGDEIDDMIHWVLGFIYGPSPSPSLEREMQAEERHFRMRLDLDGDSSISFDELHTYIFEMIRWMEDLRKRQAAAEVAAADRAVAALQAAVRGWLSRRAFQAMIIASIPQVSRDAMIFVRKIQLADAQVHKLKAYAMTNWGAVRTVCAHSRPDLEDGSGRCWGIVWLENKEKALAALAGQADALSAGTQTLSDKEHQFAIGPTDLHKIHSRRATAILGDLWHHVPNVIAAGVPRDMADEDKIKELFGQFGAVDAIAVAIDDTAPNKSWALVTFKSESAVEKATQQPVQVGTETLKVESASFSKAVEMNRITVAHGRNWKTEVAGNSDGIERGIAAGRSAVNIQLKAGAADEKGKEVVRETPEDIVARLNRSFKMNPANVERIVGRRSTRRGGGHGVAVEYEVVWQGRFVSPSWVPREILAKNTVTLGMVLEFEDNQATEAEEAAAARAAAA